MSLFNTIVIRDHDWSREMKSRSPMIVIVAWQVVGWLGISPFGGNTRGIFQDVHGWMDGFKESSLSSLSLTHNSTHSPNVFFGPRSKEFEESKNAWRNPFQNQSGTAFLGVQSEWQYTNDTFWVVPECVNPELIVGSCKVRVFKNYFFVLWILAGPSCR